MNSVREIAEKTAIANGFDVACADFDNMASMIESGMREGVTLRLKELRERIESKLVRTKAYRTIDCTRLSCIEMIDSMLTQSGDLVDEGQVSGSYSAEPANQEGGNATTPEPIDKVGGPLADKYTWTYSTVVNDGPGYAYIPEVRLPQGKFGWGEKVEITIRSLERDGLAVAPATAEVRQSAQDRWIQVIRTIPRDHSGKVRDNQLIALLCVYFYWNNFNPAGEKAVRTAVTHRKPLAIIPDFGATDMTLVTQRALDWLYFTRIVGEN